MQAPGTGAERVLGLRRLVDRLEGQWLSELSGVDAHGAAGAEEGQEAGSTAGWLRSRLRMGAGHAATSVRTARALFRGPLAATAHALVDGELSVAPTFEGMVAVDAPSTTSHRGLSRRPGRGRGE